jgi:hypothetical protein
MTLWRIHLKPVGRDVAGFCLDRKEPIVGIGWPVDSIPSTDKEYLEQCRKQYPKRRKGSVEAFLSIKENEDLVWARKGMTYYLGKVGKWRYEPSQEYKDRHIVNVRPYSCVEVGEEDNVPGDVLRNITRGQTVRRINNAHALEYSHYLYSKMRGERSLPKPEKGAERILELIGPQDLEDVVAIFLQKRRRCLMYPSTCKKSTKSVECLGVSEEDGQLIGWQVKSGKATINETLFQNFKGRVFLLQLQPKKQDERKANSCLEYLNYEEVRSFLLDPQHRTLMPRRIRNWIDYAQTGGSAAQPQGAEQPRGPEGTSGAGEQVTAL